MLYFVKVFYLRLFNISLKINYYYNPYISFIGNYLYVFAYLGILISFFTTGYSSPNSMKILLFVLIFYP